MSRLAKLLGAFALAFAFSLVAVATPSDAGVFVGLNIGIGPPALPVYEQPPCPAPNLIWTPGYWSYGPNGYFWIPGTWVAAPEIGDLWTPGYWGYDDSIYSWNAGYWGSEVGFYGGIDYGNGYFGNGFAGGRWQGRRFRYNTAYANVNRRAIGDTYDNRIGANNVYGNARSSHASYNGGPHGVGARPTSTQIAYTRQAHAGPTSVQREHAQIAAENRNYIATVNHGRPPNGAFARPLTAINRPHSFAPLSHAAYRAPQTSHAMTTYHAPRAYHATTTYHAPAAYHATTYHAPATYHAGNTMSAPRGGGMPPAGGGPRGGGAPQGGGGAPHGGGGAPHGGGGAPHGGGDHHP